MACPKVSSLELDEDSVGTESWRRQLGVQYLMWGRRTSMLGWQQQQQPSKGCLCPRKEKRINVWVKTGSPVFSIRAWTRRDHSYRRVSRDGGIMMMGDWLLIWRGSQQVNILRIMETKWITVGESSYTYKTKRKLEQTLWCGIEIVIIGGES